MAISPLLDENEFNRSEIFLVQDERRTRTPHSGEAAPLFSPSQQRTSARRCCSSTIVNLLNVYVNYGARCAGILLDSVCPLIGEILVTIFLSQQILCFSGVSNCPSEVPRWVGRTDGLLISYPGLRKNSASLALNTRWGKEGTEPPLPAPSSLFEEFFELCP